MEYITAEQFMEQPQEVQKIFLERWKPEKFDLFAWDVKGFNKVYSVMTYDQGSILPFGSPNIWNEKSQCIPLLIEGQLRRFIENKINGKVDIVYSSDTEFQFSFWKFEKYGNDYIGSQEIRANDLLQAYWQVALQIARDEVN